MTQHNISAKASRQGDLRYVPAGRPEPVVFKELLAPNSAPPKASGSMQESGPQAQQDGTRSELNTPSASQVPEIKHQPGSREFHQASLKAKRLAADLDKDSKPASKAWQPRNQPERQSTVKRAGKEAAESSIEPEKAQEATDVNAIDLMTALRQHTDILDSENLQLVQDEIIRINKLKNTNVSIIRSDQEHDVMVEIIMDTWRSYGYYISRFSDLLNGLYDSSTYWGFFTGLSTVSYTDAFYGRIPHTREYSAQQCTTEGQWLYAGERTTGSARRDKE
jgi:hypothetical protein